MGFSVPTNQQNYQVPGLTSPVGSTVLLAAVSALVIGPNQNRRGIGFFNPGAISIFVCPDNQVAVIGQGILILPGAYVPLYGDPAANITFNCGWNGIAASGVNNPLTVLELV